MATADEGISSPIDMRHKLVFALLKLPVAQTTSYCVFSDSEQHKILFQVFCVGDQTPMTTQ